MQTPPVLCSNDVKRQHGVNVSTTTKGLIIRTKILFVGLDPKIRTTSAIEANNQIRRAKDQAVFSPFGYFAQLLRPYMCVHRLC
jgi:hypothetical protein